MALPRLALALASALLLAPVGPARAGEGAALCSGSEFVIDGEPLLARSGFEGPDAIGLADGELWFASGCGPHAARLRPGADGTRVRARFFDHEAPSARRTLTERGFLSDLPSVSWNALFGLVGSRCGPATFVRVRATFSPDCQTLTGVLRARSPRLRRPFVARAASIPVCDVAHPCPGDAFCELPGGHCGVGLDAGSCVDVPEACPEVYDPVCGCDGVSYGNDCERRAARVQKSTEGTCSGLCGTIAGIPCPADSFCEFPTDQCQGADLAGVCAVVSEVCTLDWNPVCGCDGRSYGNDCERRAAAVSKHHDGECLDAGGAMTVGMP